MTGDLLDLAVALGGRGDQVGEHLAAAHQRGHPHRQLWEELSSREVFGLDERYKVAGRVRRLNELGFAVDELELEPVGEDGACLRLKVAVANRRFHGGGGFHRQLPAPGGPRCLSGRLSAGRGRR